MPQKRRVMVIGLDGASFNFVGPFCRNGIMPNLNRFWKRSCSGGLVSSYPPITPAAWVTFMTGKLAGKHHVLDYEQFRFSDYSMRYYNAADVHASSLWRIVSEHNRKVAVVNVPMTYPPERVNGILIAGHNVPSPRSEYTFPRAFKEELLSHLPDYLNAGGGHKQKHGVSFDERVAALMRTVDHYHQATKLTDSKIDWDVLMVVFPHTDMGHNMWPYMNPETSELYPRRRDCVARIFTKLDQALGDLFVLAEQRGADVLIMSDHGHGTLRGWVRPNKLLQQWGYITMLNPAKWLAKRLGWEYQKVRYKHEQNRPARRVDEKIGIDWSKTKAVVCQAVMWGFLYLNVRGRQPKGVVEPGREYDSLREELIGRFRESTAPDTGEALFNDILKPEEIYGGDRTSWDCPDLLLVPPEGVRVNRRMKGNWVAKRTVIKEALGTHLLKGLWMASGPDIKSGVTFEANIQDLAPTILTLMGLPVPDDMDGKVLADIFRTQPRISFSSPEPSDSAKRSSATYSIKEEEQIQRQLADLGYAD